MFLRECIRMCLYDDDDDDDDDYLGKRMPNGIFRTTVDSPGATNPPPSHGQFSEPSASPLEGGDGGGCAPLTLG